MASKMLRLSNNFQLISKRLRSNFSDEYRAAIANLPQTETSTLANGVRVASEDDRKLYASVGLWFDIGSRHENVDTNGIGNLFKNLAFQGTQSLTAVQLEEAAASKGITLISHFGREQSALIAKCQPKYVPDAVQLLSEAITKPRFDDADISRARNNILSEIDEITNERFEDLVIENLHVGAYQGTPLGQPLLGTTTNIERFGKKDLQNYVSNNFKGGRFVLAAAGAVDHTQLKHLAEKHLGGLDGSDNRSPALGKARYTGFDLRDRDDGLPQAYIAVAVEGPSWTHDDYLPLEIVRHYLGIWNYTETSRGAHPLDLAKECAKGKIAHKYRHFNYGYSDTALWGVYGVCEPMACETFFFLCSDEWRAACNFLTEEQLKRAKNTLKANLLRDLNGGCALVGQKVGQEILSFGRRIQFDEWEQRIDKISAGQVRDAAAKYIIDRPPVVSAVGQHENLPHYTNLSVFL